MGRPRLGLPEHEGQGTLQGFRHALHPSLAEAGLPTEVRFHDFRHTAATLVIKQGFPIPTVSKMLGHSDPAMTSRRYAHILEDMRQEAAGAMDDLFLPMPYPNRPQHLGT